MKKSILYSCLTVFLLLLVSCRQQGLEYASGKNLGQVYLSPEGGKLSVLVSLNSLWRVATDADWIRLDGNGGNGQSAFTLYYEANKSDIITSKPLRKAEIIIQRIEEQVADTLSVLQQGAPDGTDYGSVVQDNYLEFLIPELKTRKVLYVNLLGAKADRTKKWMETGGYDWIAAYDPDQIISADNDHVIRDGAFIFSTSEDHPKKTSSGESSLTVQVDGWNMVVADFRPDDDAGRQYGRIKDLLDSGYNRPLSGDLWIVGGSLYYLSVMEAGYPNTPGWYPKDPADIRFDADRYAWECNLYDSVYLTHKTFNISYSSGEKAWRADYAYVSASAWNHLAAVETIPMEDAGLQHVPCILTIKY